MLERIGLAWLRVKTLVLRRKLDRDLNEELNFHLAMRAEKYGGDHAAQMAARRQFGNSTHIRETCRELWTFAAVETFWRDLRYAVRMLARTPVFTTVAVLSLTLGIGANTALFSLVDVMLLRPLPVRNPHEIVEFVRQSPGAMMTNLPYPVFSFLSQDRSVLSDVFAIRRSQPALQAGNGPEPVRAHEVSGSFFPCLGVNAVTGRTISRDDDRAGSVNRVAVLSHAFWSRRFGKDPSIVGRTMRLSGEPFTVIGIMPLDFFGVDRSDFPDLWVPLAPDPDPGEVWVLGRLRPGVGISQAKARLEPLFQQAMGSLQNTLKLWPESDRKAFLSQRLLVTRATEGTSGLRWMYWEYSYTLKILIGLTALILLIGCTNLANLLMARSAARSGEIGVRLALGAGRPRLVRQLLTENLLLSLAGGTLGMLVAALGHRLMVGLLVRDPLNVALDFRLDYRLLGFGLTLAVMTGLLFGLMPAVRATRADLSGALHRGSRQRGTAHMPLSRGLLAVQIALSLVLLVAGGLFARSLRNLGAADLGLARENLILMDIYRTGKTPEVSQRFWMRLSGQVSALPGVRSIALAGDAVFGYGGWNQTVWIPRPAQPAQDAKVSMNCVGPGFFTTVGIPIIAGREFGHRNRENTPLVALVNQTFARRFFPNENPVGKYFGDRGPASFERYEVVGVVGDAKYGSVREETPPMVFYPLWQCGQRESLVLHLRTASEPAALLPAIRREILAVDPEALVSEVRTLPQVIRKQLREDQMFAAVASFFALLALVLASIGIYGVVAYRVAHRTAEIGVRMALGAKKADVLWLIMRETIGLLAVGALIGVPAALAAARLIKTLLFGLGPSDPLTIAGATFTLVAAGALAGFLPARRAASVEPTIALRSE